MSLIKLTYRRLSTLEKKVVGSRNVSSHDRRVARGELGDKSPLMKNFLQFSRVFKEKKSINFPI